MTEQKEPLLRRLLREAEQNKQIKRYNKALMEAQQQTQQKADDKFSEDRQERIKRFLIDKEFSDFLSKW